MRAWASRARAACWRSSSSRRRCSISSSHPLLRKRARHLSVCAQSDTHRRNRSPKIRLPQSKGPNLATVKQFSNFCRECMLCCTEFVFGWDPSSRTSEGPALLYSPAWRDRKASRSAAMFGASAGSAGSSAGGGAVLSHSIARAARRGLPSRLLKEVRRRKKSETEGDQQKSKRGKFGDRKAQGKPPTTK